MQNRYAGDVGDFGKLGLLRQVALSGLIIGVNWYLAPDETHNDDGKHIGYLTDQQYVGCDDALRTSLRSLVNNKRSVSELEAKNLIPHAIFFSEVLLPPVESFSRKNWHINALNVLKHTDVVFLDPDNGVLVKSVTLGSKKSNKYVLPREIADYFTSGKSVIFYNHRCREDEFTYLQRFSWTRKDPIIETAYLAGVKFVRGTTRDYIFLLQPNHTSQVMECVDKMLQSPWGNHFFKLNLSQ